eukprot:TRINITY_DN9096_c0_g1_i1.p1 TRINITY_DN9096_c0_g1~~TRINITY_DN9096_c0_g1_i1.p1  ORF type:complete len:320 (+),score=94.64 TRINITY_DN9096_c0_g1_i1:132-1091(+)
MFLLFGILFSFMALVAFLILTRAKSFEIPNLSGKTFVVTGSNTGIGKQTAIGLAQKGAKVILACRSKEKAMEAVEEIISLSNNSKVEFMSLDLCSMDSIRNFVSEIEKRKIEIDVLINNAGVLYLHKSFVGSSPVFTKEGWSVQFVSNYLGHYLLTRLLLENLARNGAKIVNVSSSMHYFATLNFDDLQGIKSSHVMTYCKSKLAQIYFTHSIQKLLDQRKDCKATCNAVHPGYIASDIVNYIGPAATWLFKLLWGWMGWGVESGAAAPLYVATSNELNGVGGQYFSKTTMQRSKDCSYDESIEKRLWKVSAEMVGLEN